MCSSQFWGILAYCDALPHCSEALKWKIMDAFLGWWIDVIIFVTNNSFCHRSQPTVIVGLEHIKLVMQRSTEKFFLIDTWCPLCFKVWDALQRSSQECLPRMQSFVSHESFVGRAPAGVARCDVSTACHQTKHGSHPFPWSYITV